jgi:hypothetical protein
MRVHEGSFLAESIRARVKSQAERLRRLAVVFAVELRLRIVIELYQRVMSPKQFHEQFGGGTLSRVSRNFDRLTETGWLKYLYSEGPGGDRRGGTEHFYRAPEMAFFDRETWAALPYSIRVAFSWKLFSQIAIWLREGLEAKMFQARAGSSLASRKLLLDQLGRERLIGAVTDVFAFVSEEQDDTRLRAARTGEELIRASVLQFAYESPIPGAERSPSGRLVEIPDPMTPIWVRASRVFPDELCMEIIEAANEQTISATQFHEEFGGNLETIRRRFRKVVDNGWLDGVDWKTGGKRRGGTEKFYRATRPAMKTADEFLAGIPDELKEAKAGRTFERICSDFVEAMEAETVDARTDRCVALSLVQLDREGWEKVAAALRDLWALALEEEEEAKARLAKSGEEPTAMTLALGMYETPESEKEP